jgi:hypothetical protein
MLLNLQNLLNAGKACTILFLFFFIPFLLVFSTFPGFSQNSFEKWPVAVRFFLCNAKNVSTSRKKIIEFCRNLKSLQIQKILVLSGQKPIKKQQWLADPLLI